MLHLFWLLLNIGIGIYFLLICFKATKLVREKIGLIATLVFVFGLLSFIGNAKHENDNKEPNAKQIRTCKFSNNDSLDNNDTHLMKIDLEKNSISTYQLGIKYGKTFQNKLNIPISAYSNSEGFGSSTKWTPNLIILNRTNYNNKFEYNVSGIVEWKLLGFTIYTESKNYKGLVSVK